MKPVLTRGLELLVHVAIIVSSTNHQLPSTIVSNFFDVSDLLKEG
jgi:hypothetical protein